MEYEVAARARPLYLHVHARSDIEPAHQMMTTHADSYLTT